MYTITRRRAGKEIRAEAHTRRKWSGMTGMKRRVEMDVRERERERDTRENILNRWMCMD